MKNYVDAEKLQEYTTKLVAKLKEIFPGPAQAASTVADMTDESKVYVYTGSETGYTAGNWYYWDGTAWTSGGVYNAVQIETDTTLTETGEAADAKATGDAIAAAKAAVLADLAPAYSTSATYAVGAYVVYNGGLYRCITAISTAEAWTAAHWTAVNLANDVGASLADLKSAVMQNDFTAIEKSNTHGYFAAPTSVNVLEPSAYSASYTSPIVWDKCNEGDVYKATITLLSGLYPYIICDANGNVIDHGTKSQGVTDKEIVMPPNAAYFGANQNGANDYVQKKSVLPQKNDFNSNKVLKNIPFTFNHSYIGTSSPINVSAPTTASASYTGGYLFEACSEGDIYVVNTDNIASSCYDILICDSTGTIIANSLVGRSGKFLKNWFVKIPTNGAYIGINCYTSASKVGKYIDLTYDLITSTKNPFINLKGVAFGTSLTSRSDSSGTYGYVSYLRQLLGCAIDNQGVGGSYWFLTDQSNRSVTHVVENYTNYSDKDIVIIEGCVNDWANSMVLGTYTDDVYTSVCGCLNKMIQHVYTQKPTAQIFVILDHQGRDYNNIDCSNTAVVNGKTQYEYYSELKKVCELYAIPVICEYAESSIGMYGTEYLVDNIHCNALGAKQSGQYIANKMLQYGIKAKE